LQSSNSLGWKWSVNRRRLLSESSIVVLDRSARHVICGRRIDNYRIRILLFGRRDILGHSLRHFPGARCTDHTYAAKPNLPSRNSSSFCALFPRAPGPRNDTDWQCQLLFNCGIDALVQFPPAPSLTTIWHLGMELFLRFQVYFEFLLAGVPYLTVVPITIRLYMYPAVLVSTVRKRLIAAVVC